MSHLRNSLRASGTALAQAGAFQRLSPSAKAGGNFVVTSDASDWMFIGSTPFKKAGVISSKRKATRVKRQSQCVSRVSAKMFSQMTRLILIRSRLFRGVKKEKLWDGIAGLS